MDTSAEDESLATGRYAAANLNQTIENTSVLSTKKVEVSSERFVYSKSHLFLFMALILIIGTAQGYGLSNMNSVATMNNV